MRRVDMSMAGALAPGRSVASLIAVALAVVMMILGTAHAAGYDYSAGACAVCSIAKTVDHAPPAPLAVIVSPTPPAVRARPSPPDVITGGLALAAIRSRGPPIFSL
ncbi:MAG: hypothetical protein ACK4NP_09000 [Parvularculaceae bacterium]